jgi:hypothetical protein
MSDSSRRKNLALQILNGEAPIKDMGGGIYEVPSQSVGGEYYAVNLNRNTCECPDWRKRKYPCKHIYAARMFRDGTTSTTEFASEPNPYRNPPYYDRLRREQRECIRAMLRCVGARVTDAA